MVSHPKLVYQRKLVDNVKETLTKSSISNTLMMQMRSGPPSIDFSAGTLACVPALL